MSIEINSRDEMFKLLGGKKENESKMQEVCPHCHKGKIYAYFRKGVKVWTKCDFCSKILPVHK